MLRSGDSKHPNPVRWVVAVLLVVLFLMWIVSASRQYLTVDTSASSSGMANMPGMQMTQPVLTDEPSATSMPDGMPGMDH